MFTNDIKTYIYTTKFNIRKELVKNNTKLPIAVLMILLVCTQRLIQIRYVDSNKT